MWVMRVVCVTVLHLLISITPTPTLRKTIQYNVLNEPTSVTVTDLAPQSGQSVTSVTATTQYDDLGHALKVNDPDKGTHSFTYDADGQVITDVSGSRTIGSSYDLLGRVGCVQDAAPTFDPQGACTSGAHPFVQNTYDADPNGVSWGSTNPGASLGDPGSGDEGVAIGEEAQAGDIFPSEACSFTSQTTVATDQGKQSISKLHPGNKVWAYNPKTHKMEVQPILHVWVHQDDDLVDLTITPVKPASHDEKTEQTKSELIHTNKKHPFLQSPTLWQGPGSPDPLSLVNRFDDPGAWWGELSLDRVQLTNTQVCGDCCIGNWLKEAMTALEHAKPGK
jgi:YD repeat-containing protein